MAEHEGHLDLLRQVRLFASLNDEELAQIDPLLRERRFRKGSVVFEQGDVGDALYIVESGRVKASLKDEGGKEKILALYGEGAYFGEMALITEQQRSATMTVVGDTQLLVLPKDAFEKFMAGNLTMMRQLLRVMTTRVAEVNVTAQPGEESEQAMILGKVIVFFSAKGGIGKTTLAVNLATILRQEANKSVVVVDCSYPFGDVGVMMNLEPKRTMADLLPHINELDGQIFESILQAHPSGVKVLLAPPTPEEAEVVTAEHIAMVITGLRELFEYVIVDTHSSFTEVSVATLDTADLVIVPVTLEMAALKNVRVLLDTFTNKLGYPGDKMALVVNRNAPVGGLTIQDVETSTGHKVAATITSDGRVAVTASNQGTPFVISNKNTQIYQDIVNLAKLIAPKAFEETQALYGEGEEEEELSQSEKLRAMPRRFVQIVREGVTSLNPSDLLFGMGNLLLATAPLLFIITVLGAIARAMGVNFPANAAFNLSIWVGIAGGTFLLMRLRPPTRAAWVQGGIIAFLYGIAILLPALAVLNITQGNLGSSIPGLVFTVIFYGVLGILGSILSERTKRGAQPLIT